MRLALLGVVTSLGMSAEPGRWQTLLRKDSFAGWRSPSGHTPIEGAWTIAKGVLTAKPYVQHRTDLWTTQEYENFELEWEWKAAKGANSGVKYWVQRAVTMAVVKEDIEWRPVGDPREAAGEITLEYTVGLEYQMADDAHEPASLARANSRAGGLYGLFAPSPEAVKPHDQWNRSRVVVRDGHFEHWLNGKQTLGFDLTKLETQLKEAKQTDRLGRRMGPIALQYHQTVVSFRKMRVRRL